MSPEINGWFPIEIVLFLGDMLVLGGVKVTIFPKDLRPHPSAASLDLWSSDAGVGRKEDMLPPSPDIFATSKNHPKDLGIFVFSRNVEQTKNNMKVEKLTCLSWSFHP